ncbi:MAG: DedA family protein [Hyphomicrobiaceae bacterium]
MGLQEYADAIIAFVRSNPQWVAPVVFLLAFGESIAFVSLILPFWGMLVALGGLIGGGDIKMFASVWAAASIGAALGDWVSYWLGRHFHEPIGKMWPLSRYPDLLPRGHAFMEKYGAWAIVLGRFSGPFRASVPIVAGATEMDRVKFQIANWSSAFLWAFVLLKFGDAIGHVLAWLRRYFGS